MFSNRRDQQHFPFLIPSLKSSHNLKYLRFSNWLVLINSQREVVVCGGEWSWDMSLSSLGVRWCPQAASLRVWFLILVRCFVCLNNSQFSLHTLQSLFLCFRCSSKVEVPLCRLSLLVHLILQHCLQNVISLVFSVDARCSIVSVLSGWGVMRGMNLLGGHPVSRL